MRRTRRGSISRRLAIATMAFILVASLAVSALQLRQQYLQDVATARARMTEIERGFVPGLTAAVWMVDPSRIELLMDGAMRAWRLAHLRVRTSEGEVYERGRDPGADAIARGRFALVHRDGAAVEVGQLEVTMDDTAMRAGIRQRAVSRALGLTIGIGLGAACLLLLIRFWVTRHLRRLAEYARGLRPDTLHEPLVLEGRSARRTDELDDVAAAFNRMRVAMLKDLDRRRRDEAELAAHRERLEDLVEARTRELTETARELEAQRDAVQRLANTDALTGVGSRRHFQECADRELARAQRDEVPLSLLMLDIDHFKRINDTYGHGVGDLVLKRFAQLLQHHFAQAPGIGRLGGEEFAVVLPGWNATRAGVLAELVRQAVERDSVTVAGRGAVRFTTSMGLATYQPGQPASVETLLRDADAALYRAKAAGRNRLETAPSTHPAP